MKKLLVLLFVAAAITIPATGQRMDRSVRPVPAYPVIFRPGWIIMTDISYGIGLGATNDPLNPCDKSYISLTPAFGYQVSRSFLAAAGVGAMFNEDRFFVPVFARIRYTIPVVNDRIAPYINADGGLLFNFRNINTETRTYVNPGFGARFLVSPYTTATAEAGLLIHHGPGTPRNSFLSIKAGFLILLKKD